MTGIKRSSKQIPEQDLAANGHLQNILQRNIGAGTDILCGCQVVTAHVDIGITIVSDRSCRAISEGDCFISFNKFITS